MTRKTIDIFLPIISQPKSEYRPIEFVQTQAIYIHQVNNQTNLISVATMTLCLYLLHVSGPTCCSTTSTPSSALVK